MKCDCQWQVAVVGGDIRQIAVVKALIGMASQVKVYGHPRESLPKEAQYSSNIEEALAETDIVILPIGGMNDAGMVRGYQSDQFIDFGRYFHILPKGVVVLSGSLTPKWLEQGAKRAYRMVQYAEDDAIAIHNSIPTAEGAVQIAMEQLPITIHGASVLVIGFGRVGMTVARTFQGLGAKVTVAARRSAALARAAEMGYTTLPLPQLATGIGAMRIVINTVPALILDAPMLQRSASDALLIDLASAPGGIDYEAAGEIGRNAVFAPGLPGKVAPETAGAILATAIPELIIATVSESEHVHTGF